MAVLRTKYEISKIPDNMPDIIGTSRNNVQQVPGQHYVPFLALCPGAPVQDTAPKLHTCFSKQVYTIEIKLSATKAASSSR